MRKHPLPSQDGNDDMASLSHSLPSFTTMQYEPITIGQLKAFTAAFQGHPNYTHIYATAKTLTKKQAHEIVETFYRSSYSDLQAASESVRENAKAKIPKALKMLKQYGYVERCGICTAPKDSCSC